MAKDLKVGLTMTGDSSGAVKSTEAVKKGLKSAGTAATATAKAFLKLERNTGQTLDTFFKLTTGVNQLLEIYGKLRNVAKATLGTMIEKSLAARSEHDANRKALAQFTEEADRTWAALGNHLVPVLSAAAAAARPLLNRIRGFAENSKDVIDSKIAGYLASLVPIAATAAKAIAYMAKVSLGLVGAFDLLKWTVNSLLALLSSFDDEISGVFQSSADAASKDIEELAAELKGLDEVIANIDPIANEFLANALDALEKYQAAAVQTISVTAEETADVVTKAAKNSTKAQKIEADNSSGIWESASQSIGAGLGTAFAAGIEGSKSFAQIALDTTGQVLNTVIQSVLKTIAARSAEAGASAMASMAPLGPFGLAAGIGLAGAFTASILGMLSSVPTARFGAVVTGGTPGRDSVPILAEPGEMVVPLPEMRRQMQGRGGDDVRRAEFHIHPPTPMSGRELDRWTRNYLAPSLMRLGLVRG